MKFFWRLKSNSVNTIFRNPYILFVSLVACALSYVFFRMKGVEQDYSYSELLGEINNSEYQNKELKAERARLISIENLWDIAKKHDLTTPADHQIILIGNKKQ